MNEFAFLVLFLRSFRLQCAEAVVPSWFMMTERNNTIAALDGGHERARDQDTLGRPKNIRSGGILIFLVLCQTGRASYLCDDQLEAFSVSGIGPGGC